MVKSKDRANVARFCGRCQHFGNTYASINHLDHPTKKGYHHEKQLDRKASRLDDYSCRVLVSGFLIFGSPGVATQAATSAKKMMHEKAYSLYQSKCLGCHMSVADPEKAGRTRDDWHLVVQVMHGYGLDLTDVESEMIIDLLYDLRQGMEKEAG
jgi:hypothetical protein